jgi:hypothetical protein
MHSICMSLFRDDDDTRVLEASSVFTYKPMKLLIGHEAGMSYIVFRGHFLGKAPLRRKYENFTWWRVSVL